MYTHTHTHTLKTATRGGKTGADAFFEALMPHVHEIIPPRDLFVPIPMDLRISLAWDTDKVICLFFLLLYIRTKIERIDGCGFACRWTKWRGMFLWPQAYSNWYNIVFSSFFLKTNHNKQMNFNHIFLGGAISRDFTQGYGPEEYFLRRAIAGCLLFLFKSCRKIPNTGQILCKSSTIINRRNNTAHPRLVRFYLDFFF